MRTNDTTLNDSILGDIRALNDRADDKTLKTLEAGESGPGRRDIPA